MMDAGDPYLWLEEINDERAMAWVLERNRESMAVLTELPLFSALFQRFRTILDARERIPDVRKHGEWLYNFWRDKERPRGVLRRTSLTSFKTSEPVWDLVLDLDALAEQEGENWVWHGFQPRHPDYTRALVSLSRGGADADVVREFDLESKAFVANEFHVPEAKSRISWKDADTLYVASDFGFGSLTDSGYPRTVREWKRGALLADAPTVFAGERQDVSVGAYVKHDRGRAYCIAYRRLTFWTSEAHILRNGRWIKIDKPDDAEIDTFADQLLLTLRSDWTLGGQTYAAGSLLADNLENWIQGRRAPRILFTPGPRTALEDVDGTRNYLIVNTLDNVRSRVFRWQKTAEGWRQHATTDSEESATVSVYGVDPHASDAYWMRHTAFLTPSSLWLGNVDGGKPEMLKRLPAFFNADGLTIEQREAISADGTRVPYFQVCREKLERNGRHATLLYGYGGFEVSLLSQYTPLAGAGWLERGGVYVVANIRGGGEFGPAWHQAALKDQRQKAYDDFIAVAEDLIQRKVTSPKHLGIMGGSNGGLLVGNMLVQRPDLFGAVVCLVPLLDMQRYHKLLAGASWMGEFGDPDKAVEWAYLRRYSPYHNVAQDAEYPPVLFTTSTRDDRVHPGHARKMTASMKAMGHDVLYYENTEGGHAVADNRQRAYLHAMAYAFLWQQLGEKRAEK